jgi:hypothetical protein
MAVRKPDPEPEIIPPARGRPGPRIDDSILEGVARLLDDAWVIPGTRIRFGLDPLIGLIPVLGDVISGFFAFFIVFAAWQRGVSRLTIARMVVNIAIDDLIGSIPLVGDAFDVAWKSNRMNISLLQRERIGRGTRNLFLDGLFLFAIALVALALIAAPFALVWLLLARR